MCNHCCNELNTTTTLLLNTTIDESEWRSVLAEPFECERRMLTEPAFPHTHDIIYIAAGRLPALGKKRRRPTWETIGQVMFVWDNKAQQQHMWDDAEWMCIGKTNDSPFYFAFLSHRCGTGFGLCETSTMYLAKTLEEIWMCALTDSQRAVVEAHINNTIGGATDSSA